MKPRVLVADDEPLARERLRQLLGDEVEIVAECSDGAETIEAVRALDPDVLLLDIRMSDMDGFAVLEALRSGSRMPAVIFVTAYDAHALRAFEARALDYLLKPIVPDRLREALDRVRERMARTDEGFGPRIALCDGARVIFVETATVDWIESAGNYAIVHVGVATHIVRETLGTLEAMLPEAAFLRVSRSVIVNLARVREMQRRGGQNEIILAGGQCLPVTRSFEMIAERMGRR